MLKTDAKIARFSTVMKLIRMGVLYVDRKGFHCAEPGIYRQKNSASDVQSECAIP